MEKARDFTDLIRIEGKVIGINLGFYPCHEHEWGIKGIESAFGVHHAGYGFISEIMTKLPAGVFFGQRGQDHYLVYDEKITRGYQFQNKILREVPSKKEERERLLENLLQWDIPAPNWGNVFLLAAWDSTKFAVRARGEIYGPIFESLETAFLEHDVVFDTKSHLSRRFGLIIYSAIPPAIKRQFEQKEIDDSNLVMQL